MANTNGKRARRTGGNRFDIKKSWRKSKRAAYREGDKERQRQHAEFRKAGP